jgi:hypothetical protein
LRTPFSYLSLRKRWLVALILSQPAENPAAAELWILIEIWIFLISGMQQP